MPTNVKEMMAAANAAVPRLNPDDVWKFMRDTDVPIQNIRQAFRYECD